MLRIKLGARTYVGDTQATHPFLPRRHAGWDPTMTDGEVYDAARGWWRLNARAEQERAERRQIRSSKPARSGCVLGVPWPRRYSRQTWLSGGENAEGLPRQQEAL